MSINKDIQEELNNQLSREFYSAYLYLAMSAYFDSINLKGFSHWMRLQAKEETQHALKIYDFILERGGKVRLVELGAPPSEWSSPLSAFEEAYKHEKSITEAINNIATLARSEKDYATEVFLQWFISEQVEEEASTSEILEKLRLIGDSTGGVFMLDHRLSKRE